MDEVIAPKTRADRRRHLLPGYVDRSVLENLHAKKLIIRYIPIKCRLGQAPFQP